MDFGVVLVRPVAPEHRRFGLPADLGFVDPVALLRLDDQLFRSGLNHEVGLIGVAISIFEAELTRPRFHPFQHGRLIFQHDRHTTFALIGIELGEVVAALQEAGEHEPLDLARTFEGLAEVALHILTGAVVMLRLEFAEGGTDADLIGRPCPPHVLLHLGEDELGQPPAKPLGHTEHCIFIWQIRPKPTHYLTRQIVEQGCMGGIVDLGHQDQFADDVVLWPRFTDTGLFPADYGALAGIKILAEG